MKKTITALILAWAVIFMSAGVFAIDHSNINTADALNELGLFLGTGNGYELEKGLSRAEGVTLLVRMIGKESAAKSCVYENDFTDVPEWAAGYIGYAFENGITKGTGATTFSPDEAMTDYMFLTLVLRALDYSDMGEEPLFVWNDPYKLAQALELIETAEADTDFTRADAIAVFWKALDVNLHNVETTLAEWLVEQEVFTAGELAEARAIQQNGRKENIGVPVIPTPETDAPEAPDTPDTPEVPDTPDAPEVPDTPDTPEVPDTPETPEIPETPETPEIPDAPDTPEVPETPEIPDTPETPELPDTPDVPETPETPDTPDVPETPDAPETDAPETGNSREENEVGRD